MNQFTTKWTEDDLQTVRTMRADGEPMSKIGVILGCSRNAVAGLISRLKLPPSGTPRPQIRQIRHRPNAQTVRAKPKWKQPPPIPAEEPVQASSEPPPNAKSFDELLTGECRWPYGDGVPYLFCAAPMLKGSSYCGPHCRAAHSTRKTAFVASYDIPTMALPADLVEEAA